MIIKLLLNIMGFIGSTIINIVTSILPESGLGGQLSNIIVGIIAFTQQALNFVYFVCGETIFFVLPIAILVLIAKYTVIPIVTIFRSFFVNSND